MERESEAGDDRPEGIDFAELSSINPDIYAWIRIPDTQIDYPVPQREEDDTYYLRHNSSWKICVCRKYLYGRGKQQGF